jgi:hypothetical protein
MTEKTAPIGAEEMDAMGPSPDGDTWTPEQIAGQAAAAAEWIERQEVDDGD